MGLDRTLMNRNLFSKILATIGLLAMVGQISVMVYDQKAVFQDEHVVKGTVRTFANESLGSVNAPVINNDITTKPANITQKEMKELLSASGISREQDDESRNHSIQLIDDNPLPSNSDNTDQEHGTSQSNPVTSKLLKSKEDISVLMIVVASHQRSSSTFLSHDILGRMDCHLSLNEILTSEKKQSGDAWTTVGSEMQLNATSKKNPSTMAAFVLEVARRRCYVKLSMDEDLQKQCNNHCWSNYKHFPHHLPDNHEQFWEALIEQNYHNSGDSSTALPSFAMVILERDVKSQYRSYWFAMQTGDWHSKGKKAHKEKLAEIEDQVPYNSSEALKFYETHKNWFKRVRTFANESLGSVNAPVINLSYNDTTTRPVNITQKEMKLLLSEQKQLS